MVDGRKEMNNQSVVFKTRSGRRRHCSVDGADEESLVTFIGACDDIETSMFSSWKKEELPLALRHSCLNIAFN